MSCTNYPKCKRGAFCGGPLPTKLVHFDWLKREPLISIKKEPGTRIASRLSLVVPLTGLEPVRILLRGILSPLCLPIPPQRQHYYYTTEYQPCQAFFQKNSGRNIHHLLSQSSCGTILFSKVPKYAILISRSNEQASREFLK